MDPASIGLAITKPQKLSEPSKKVLKWVVKLRLWGEI